MILGYGPVGRAVDELLRDSELETVIVDLNMDTVQAVKTQGRIAIYGDASNIEVLSDALPNAKFVVITLPHSDNRGPLIAAVKLINPQIRVFVWGAWRRRSRGHQRVVAHPQAAAGRVTAIALKHRALRRPRAKLLDATPPSRARPCCS